MVNRFKYIEIDYEAISLLAAGTEQAAGETPGAFQMEDIPSPGRRISRSPTMMYDKLLSEVELNKVKDRFKEDVEASLEEAIRKHVSNCSQFFSFLTFVFSIYIAQLGFRRNTNVHLRVAGLLCL